MCPLGVTNSVALALFFAFGWAPTYLFRSQSFSAALPHYSAAERFWVGTTALLMSVHMTAACLTVTFTPDIPVWRICLGALMFTAGIGFWLWGRVQIGPLMVRRLPEDPPLRFRQDGAFGIVRHPLYLGMLVAAGAPVVVAPRVYLLVSFALCAMVLAVRAAQEEQHLRAQLGGAYDAYCQSVKRLVPLVW